MRVPYEAHTSVVGATSEKFPPACAQSPALREEGRRYEAFGRTMGFSPCLHALPSPKRLRAGRRSAFRHAGVGVHKIFGAPGVTRTRGTRIRNPLLYPPELQGQRLNYRTAVPLLSMSFARLLKNGHLLRFPCLRQVLRRCSVRPSTPHSSGFRRHCI